MDSVGSYNRSDEAKLGLPDWGAFAKQEHITLEYVQNRVDWMRRVGMIR